MILGGHNENTIYLEEFNVDKKYLRWFESAKINEEYDQFVMDNQIKGQEQLRNVLKRICVNLHDKHNSWSGVFLEIPVDWREEVEEGSIIRIRRYIMIKNLTAWQNELLKRLWQKEGIIKFYIFENDGVSSFWVIAKEPSTDFVLSCAEEYIDVLGEYADNMECDFMVFGENEVCEELLPANKIVIDREKMDH